MKEAHLNRHRGNRGQTLPAIGFCLMVIMAFGALAVDMGYLDYQHMRMQNATDDAALKGARALIPNSTARIRPRRTRPLKRMPISTASGQSAQINVTVHNPPQANDGPYAGVNCAVSVEINVPQTTTWFLKLFNAPSGMPITTQAVALMENNNPGCIFLLNPSVTDTFTGAYINAPSCALEMNGTGNGAVARKSLCRRLVTPTARHPRGAPSRTQLQPRWSRWPIRVPTSPAARTLPPTRHRAADAPR